MKSFENPHAQQAARDALKPFIVPLDFSREQHQAREDCRQAAQGFHRGMERQVHPDDMRPEEMDEQAGRERDRHEDDQHQRMHQRWEAHLRLSRLNESKTAP